MCLARTVAGWSKDPSTKVGAVIVKDRHIKSTGYNGFPKGIEDDVRLDVRELKYPRIVHAEMNAILQAGYEARGATLYMFFPGGGVPCADCTKHIITAGIERIVVAKGDQNDRWMDSQKLAFGMLTEAGIIIDEVEL